MQEKEVRSIGSLVSKGLRYFVSSGGNFKKVFYILKDCLKASLDKVAVSSETTNVDNGGSKRIALQTIAKPGLSKKSKAFFNREIRDRKLFLSLRMFLAKLSTRCI